MPDAMNPDLLLRRGDAGAAVADVQRRLHAAGFHIGDDDAGTFLAGTDAALRSFQHDRGLRVDGICGQQTWAALVEAGYRPGDRYLYLHSPMLRGDDVTDLQRRLAALGFDCGRVDGIFGPDTERALSEFQRNVGLTVDGVAGRDTRAALGRLGDRTEAVGDIATVRERARLLDRSTDLVGHRVVVGDLGGAAQLAHAVVRLLHAGGVTALDLGELDASEQATAANGFGADVYLGLLTRTDPECRVSYFATPSWTSVGGRSLAEVTADVLTTNGWCKGVIPDGMAHPALRETRMPAILVELGPAELLVRTTGTTASLLHVALARWVAGEALD